MNRTLVKTLSQGLTFVRKQYEDQKSIIINLSKENQAKRDEMVEKNHQLAVLQNTMAKMVMKSAISNKGVARDMFSRIPNLQIHNFFHDKCLVFF